MEISENAVNSLNKKSDGLAFQKLLKDSDACAMEIRKFFTNSLTSALNEPDKNIATKGISLLDLKNHLMINYLIDLTYLISQKFEGRSIKANEAVLRLAENRVVFEKIRPIESKLKYQIDKLMKILTDKNSNDSDPLRFKPKLDQFDDEMSQNDESEDTDNDDEKSSKNHNAAYVPPKLMAMPYEDERDRNQKTLEWAKRRALNSSLVRDLHEQYSEAPVEIREEYGNRKRSEYAKMKQRVDYEENNLMRTRLTKNQKKSTRKSATESTLSSLLNFGDYNVDEIANKNTKKFRSSAKDKTKMQSKRGKFTRRK